MSPSGKSGLGSKREKGVYTQWMGTMEEDPESGLWSYTFDTTPYADADSGANEDGYYICFEEWLGSVLVQHLIPV